MSEHRLASADLLTRAIDRLGLLGGAWRELAVRLDMARSLGVMPVWRRLRSDALLAKLKDDHGAERYQRIWTEAAHELGAEAIELPGGFLEFRAGDAWTRVLDNLVMLDDAVTLRFALEKAIVNDRLRESGLPVPDGITFDAGDLSPALAFLDAGPTPCVVKPVAGHAGYATTAGIRTRNDLLRARLRASRVDRRLLIERHVRGESYRFLVLDGKLLDVVRRHPPSVIGNGRSTIDELIEEENRRRIALRHEVALWPLHIDLDCVFTLQDAGLTLSSVVPTGVRVPVKTVVSQGTMHDNETVREPVAPQLVESVLRSAEVVGLRLAGVDVITPDLGCSLQESGGVILEVNGPPGLRYHYDVADPARATRVAVPILQALLSDRR